MSTGLVDSEDDTKNSARCSTSSSFPEIAMSQGFSVGNQQQSVTFRFVDMIHPRVIRNRFALSGGWFNAATANFDNPACE